MSIQIASTTDSKETVTAAMGDLAQGKVQETEKAEPADKTADEKAEASDASKEVKPKEKLEAKDSDDENEIESDDDDDEVEDKPKKKGGFKKRIDKLNKRADDAKRDAEYWKAQALKGQPQETKPEPKVETKAEGKPNADDFKTHDEYVEALADWKVEQKLKAAETKQREAQFKTEHQKKVQTHVERVQSFADKHEDFNELMEEVDDIPMSTTVQEVILDSENGPELMYELAKNKDEFARICKLPPLAAARALGKFEAKIAKAADSSTEKEVKTTKAPAPIKPVGSGKTGSGKKSIDDPNLSQREFEKMREEQIAQRA